MFHSKLLWCWFINCTMDGLTQKQISFCNISFHQGCHRVTFDSRFDCFSQYKTELLHHSFRTGSYCCIIIGNNLSIY